MCCCLAVVAWDAVARPVLTLAVILSAVCGCLAAVCACDMVVSLVDSRHMH